MSARGGVYEGPGGQKLHGDGREVSTSLEGLVSYNQQQADAMGISLTEWLRRRNAEYEAKQEQIRLQLRAWLLHPDRTPNELAEVTSALIAYNEEYGCDQAFCQFLNSLEK